MILTATRAKRRTARETSARSHRSTDDEVQFIDDAEPSEDRLIYWSDNNDKLWRMDITSFILTQCIQRMGSVTPEEVSKASHEVIVSLWRAGWFTEEELIGAIAKSEAQFMDDELVAMLQEEKDE
jgi:hypothetical protein